MSIKRRLSRFVFPNYMCNGTDVYTSAWVWTLNASFNSI